MKNTLSKHLSPSRLGRVICLEETESTNTYLKNLAAEAPDDLAASSVQLVDGGGIAGGDEEVVVVVHLYGVDVEVVELVAVVLLIVGLLDADMVQAVPLEEDLPALDV